MSSVMTPDQLNRKVFELLFNEIGVADTLRFINQFCIGSGNYIEMKEKIFANMTVEDIVAEIKKSH